MSTAMTSTTVIPDRRPRQGAKARPAQAAAKRAPVANAAELAVWPPATVDFSACRAEARALRAQAIGGALQDVGAWLHGLVTTA